MKFYLLSDKDNTLYGGYKNKTHYWCTLVEYAKAYPTYHQANLALLALDRAYKNVGYYTTKIIDENEASKYVY